MSKYLSIIQCYQVKFQWYDTRHRSGEGRWIDCAESLGRVVSVWLESSAAQHSDRGGESLRVLWVEAAALAATESTAAIVVVVACIRSAPAPLHRGAMIRHPYWFTILHNSAIRCRDFNEAARNSLAQNQWTFSYEWHYQGPSGRRTTNYHVDLGRALKRTSALQGRQTDRQIRRHAGRQAWRGVASSREGKQAGRDACAVAPSQGQLAVSALSLLLSFFLIATSDRRLQFCFCRRRSSFFSGRVAPAQHNTWSHSNAVCSPGYYTLLSRTQAR